jgi:hypothetical protein
VTSRRTKPGAIEVVPVSGKKGIARFMAVAPKLHKDDRAYIAPLPMMQGPALTPGHNPFFANADVQLFVANRDGKDVGRISAQVDHHERRLRPEAPGHFGFLAAIDDAEVIGKLLGTAEAWLRARGLDRVQGPFSFSTNEETGLLVDGFDTPPVLAMPHDRAYLGPHLQALGYAPVKDLFAYAYDIQVELPDSVRSLLRRDLPPNVTLRPMNMKNYGSEIRAITDIFNDAWLNNWGFVPLTEADTDAMARDFKLLLNEKLVWFAEVDQVPVAFVVCLPNLNEAIRDLKGRLFPIGWLKLLWRLKVAGVKTGRVPLMGVRRQYANNIVGALLPFAIIDAVRREAMRRGMKMIELSWILEDNRPMRRIIEAIGGRPYKTYRIYEKALGPT